MEYLCISRVCTVLMILYKGRKLVHKMYYENEQTGRKTLSLVQIKVREYCYRACKWFWQLGRKFVQKCTIVNICRWRWTIFVLSADKGADRVVRHSTEWKLLSWRFFTRNHNLCGITKLPHISHTSKTTDSTVKRYPYTRISTFETMIF